MIFYKNLLIVIALVVSFYIIFLVRKSKLHIMQLFWWLIVIFSLLLFGIFPALIDSVGHFLEIGYPPILIVVLAYVFLLIKLIHMDKYITENEIRIKELVQKIAILENEVHEKNIKEAKYEKNNDN